MSAIAFDNNLVPGPTRAYQSDDTKTYKQGQFVKRSAGTAIPATAVADGPTVVGIVQTTAPMESEPLGPNAAFPDTVTVMERGTFRMKGKDGETYVPHDALEIDPDSVPDANDGQSVRLNSAGSNDPLNITGYVSERTPAAGITIDVTGDVRFVEFDLVPLGLGADVIVH